MLACVTCAVAVVGCDTHAGTEGPLVSAPATRYLLTIDQLATPDFTVTDPAHSEDIAALAAADSTSQQQLRDEGFRGAASVRYSRPVEVGTSNGPIDVIATVELFGSSDGAHHAFARTAQRYDSESGAAPVSTGSLGDEAHADSLLRTAPSGIELVQITVVWRVANAVNVLIVRGRYGGARLDDALLLAHRMSQLL